MAEHETFEGYINSASEALPEPQRRRILLAMGIGKQGLSQAETDLMTHLAHYQKVRHKLPSSFEAAEQYLKTAVE